jgi:hypothetical protein
MAAYYLTSQSYARIASCIDGYIQTRFDSAVIERRLTLTAKHQLTRFITYATLSHQADDYQHLNVVQIARSSAMPSKNPRINVVCEPPIYYELAEIAKQEGTSVSSLAGSLMKEALELREDRALAAIADQRAGSFDHKTALSLDQVFGA